MQEVEATEAGNLGASVLPIVEPRINEIAGSRYGLRLSSTLGGDGTLQTTGGARELATISVGTWEQIATLFRLALAERLRSTIVLDDQLVQSDSERMHRFLNLLQEVSGRAQIIVFTCRPDEYKVEGATMIDLHEVMHPHARTVSQPPREENGSGLRTIEGAT